MPKRITQEQRDAVLHMLADGHDRDSFATIFGVTPAVNGSFADVAP